MDQREIEILKVIIDNITHLVRFFDDEIVCGVEDGFETIIEDNGSPITGLKIVSNPPIYLIREGELLKLRQSRKYDEFDCDIIYIDDLIKYKFNLNLIIDNLISAIDKAIKDKPKKINLLEKKRTILEIVRNNSITPDAIRGLFGEASWWKNE